ncbi:MAG: glycine--tRNA ligase subunit beta [Xanthomonas sp.]|nr:glycine--tRNA ligase subunit beta [Xanthomonas sp.]
MSEQKSLLIELGTEELPVKALPGLAQAFFDGVTVALEKRGIGFERGDAKPLYTPRRLAVLLPAVDVEQPEQTSEVLGPYLNIALDANGAPTKALEGFATKSGIDWTQLERTTDGKGERFVHRAVKPGAQTADLLADIVRDALAGMPIPKPMRWGDHDYAFARPVHWLVLLLGKDVVPAEVLGVTSDRMSRGHRFEHDKPVWINDPDDYVIALEGAKVLVDPDARRARIVAEAHKAAEQAGGSARITDDNLEQVVCLTEWPAAVLCSFEAAFLAVPQEALIETMEINQKFFPVLSDGGKLTEHFIGIANIESQNVEEVRKGYERVIRPRFADAKFFFDEDLKQGLASMGDGLKEVVYHAKLGSYSKKIHNMRTVAFAICRQLNVSPDDALEAVDLCKADLQSRLVNEFPELQGIAGGYYAKAAGLPTEVVTAIAEAYAPRHAGEKVATSLTGKIVALADRADTLAGGFYAGLKPTGSKDPFALRRVAQGFARTLIEGNIDLDIRKIISSAVHGYPAGGSNTSELSDQQATDLVAQKLNSRTVEILEFILDRLQNYYADQGFPRTYLDAAAEPVFGNYEQRMSLQAGPGSLLDFDRRVKAIGVFASLPEAPSLAASNKRIQNILKKHDGHLPQFIDGQLLVERDEKDLFSISNTVLADTDSEITNGRYVNALVRLSILGPYLDSFFASVMVNADDQAVRANRLALLKRLADRFRAVAAIEHLSS